MTFPFASPDRLLAHFERTGDPRSLGRLFDRVAPELLRIAAWLCGNRSDAEDLLQRTFLTVLTSRGSYDADRRALPWLCGILGNHAKKLAEQRTRRDEQRPLAGERDPAATAADREFAAAVARVRAELGSPYAEVLDLHLAEGLDAKRIAERLGRPAGTVRTQIVRGLELLRRHLPSGFVAGALLTAGAQAAALAAVRNIVVEQATAAAEAVAGSGVILAGGVLMAKKAFVLVPLLLGLGGLVALSLWRGDGEGLAVTPKVNPLAAQLESPRDRVAAAVRADAKSDTLREVVRAVPAIAPDPGFATLVVRIRWADDQSPAAVIGLAATPQPDDHLHEREGLTDAQGSVVLRQIRPGPCWLQSAFTETQQLELAADTVRSLDLEAKRTGVLEGTVVDARERPVAAARLWLSDHNSPFKGFEVGRTGDDGRFTLSFVEGQQIGARKAGHAPSRLHYLAKANPNLVLTLPGAGGTVRGRVVDGETRPIVGARVEVGLMGGWGVQTSSLSERLTHPTAPKLTTDAHGEFLCEGIATGNTEVRAWASGFGAASVFVDVADGRDSTVVVTLPIAAIVEGVVRDQAGRPLANAAVTKTGLYFDFGRPGTRTDAEGRYRLGDLPPGSVSLSVVAREGRANETIVTTAAATTKWNPVVAVAGRAVVGRVLRPDGAPLANVLVGVVTSGSPQADPQTRTDTDGAFVLRQVETATVILSVETEDTRLALRPNVVVGDEPVLITLTAAEMPTAHLRGRVVDVDGKPVAALLTLALASWVRCPYTDADTNGAFHRGSLPAGDYIVHVDAKGFGRSALAPVHLEPGDDKTLPDIVLARAGHVELELRGSDPAARGGLIKIVRDDGVSMTWVSLDGDKATAELPPGAYVAVAEMAATKGSVAFIIRSEQTTHATLAFLPAANVTFECRIVPSTLDDTVEIGVRDSGGALVDSVDLLLMHSRPGEPVAWRTTLPTGTYTVTARSNGGRTATARAAITDTAAPATIGLDFRPR